MVTNVTAGAGQAGSNILTAFVNAALDIIQGIIKSAPLYLFQLFIVTLLVWYLLVVGDHVVAEFKSLAPRNRQGVVNAFLGHLNSIYHALYVNYILAAVISGVIALCLLPNNRRAVCVYVCFPDAHCRDHSDHWEGSRLRPCLALLFGIGDPIKAIWVLILSIIIFQLIVGIYLIPIWGVAARRAYRNLLPSSLMLFRLQRLGLSGSL